MKMTYEDKMRLRWLYQQQERRRREEWDAELAFWDDIARQMGAQ